MSTPVGSSRFVQCSTAVHDEKDAVAWIKVDTACTTVMIVQ